MFGSGSRTGLAAARIFWIARETSRREVVGARYPMELTHRTRLSRANRRMRCVLDSGSPLQSWLKQSMSRLCSGPALGPWLRIGLFSREGGVVGAGQGHRVRHHQVQVVLARERERREHG